MALRLIEIMLTEQDGDKLEGFLQDHRATKASRIALASWLALLAALIGLVLLMRED